jgi:hypothetical protein
MTTNFGITCGQTFNRIEQAEVKGNIAIKYKSTENGCSLTVELICDAAIAP